MASGEKGRDDRRSALMLLHEIPIGRRVRHNPTGRVPAAAWGIDIVLNKTIHCLYD
jgi:hypothetical protein